MRRSRDKKNGGLCAALHTAPKRNTSRWNYGPAIFLSREQQQQGRNVRVHHQVGFLGEAKILPSQPRTRVRSFVRRVVGEDRQAQDLWAGHVDRSDCSLVWLWLSSSFEQLASEPDPGFAHVLLRCYNACRICLYYNDIKRTVRVICTGRRQASTSDDASAHLISCPLNPLHSSWAAA
jgi:hypothetical protein